MFLHALDVLARRKTEVPSAYLLTDLIVHEIRRHKGTLTEVIDAQISEELRALLDGLLEKTEGSMDKGPELQRFKLTLLKKISQSTKPARIRATLEDWQTLRRLYDEITLMIATLDLTHDGLRYYANAVLKSQVFQVSRRADEDRHLHLVCFSAHQFYRLQDTLIDILLTSVQTALNACTRHHKEQYYAARTDQRRAPVAFVDTVDRGAFSPLKAIEAIVFNPELSDPDKVQRIQRVLTERSSERDTAQENFVSFKAQTQRQAADAEYYDVLASQSRKLQNRVAEIVKVLAFEGDEASDLMAAMQHYKAKDGQISQAAPLGFLESEEQEAVLDETGDIRVSLYKALLFAKIAEALKGGVLNLRHSYKYRSLDDYLIPKDDWQAHRHDYLQRANLMTVADCEPTLNHGERVEQEIAENCRRLIKNAIICWNYLYLTQRIAEAESEERRQALLTAVRNGSVETWQHVNLHGEYDFSDEKLQDSIGLSVPEILAVNVI